MKRVSFLFQVSIFLHSIVAAQVGVNNDSARIVSLNQQIDDHVVQRNLVALDSLYAGDFVFSHGSGRVEGKKGWLVSVGRNNYPRRQHDSVTVELHLEIAIVKGRMMIERINKEKTDKYNLKYIRVYSLRNKSWQLVSHSTTHEFHEP